VLAHQVATGFGCAPTSSVGRLFDAVAALAGVRQVVDYEAQAAIEFEALARTEAEPRTYNMPIVTGPVGAALVADPAPLIRAVAADVHAGAPAAGISRGFHSALVDYTRAIADRARRSVGLDTVALTGGVFQNALLLSACRRGLRADGFTVLCHRHVPPNDGGLALGQLLVGSSG
jgi:hydrogenase maturation protein HypF